jgi:hypothetical protein
VNDESLALFRVQLRAEYLFHCDPCYDASNLSTALAALSDVQQATSRREVSKTDQTPSR